MAVVDTHIHVFVRGLPLAPVRRYAPDYDATLDDYRARMGEHGISHAVIVQPSFLGTDNSFMCAALRQSPSQLRGIAVVAPGIAEHELAALDADGVVGIRLNLDGLPLPDFEQREWKRLLESVARRGWHVEVHRDGRDLPHLVAPLLDAGVDVVVDHFGRPDDVMGVDDPGFRYLLAQGRTRRVWSKLSAAYRNGNAGRGSAMAPRAAQLLLEHLGPDRLLWGSDWPHTRHEAVVQIADTQRAFEHWIGDAGERAQILGANALSRYRFDAAQGTQP
jgi:predicted TIM-barrel fold metal-dependent hydrolase